MVRTLLRTILVATLAAFVVLPPVARAGVVSVRPSAPKISLSGSGGGGGGGSVLPEFPYDSTRSIVAGSLYVSPGGSNSNNCLSTGAACQTIAGAIGKMGTSSSKIIYLMAGTHTMSAAINFTTSGTSGTPFQITSLPGATPVIDINRIYRAFNLDGVDWWRISHLTVINWGAPSNGDDGAFVIGEDATASNNSFYALDGTTPYGGDNYAMFHVFGQRTSGLTIDRLKIRFTGNNVTAHQNTAGIYVVRLSGTGAISVNHADISGFPIGFYHKHGEEGRTTLSGGTVSNTIITQTNRLNAGYNPAGWVYDNVILGTSNSNNTLAEEDGGPAGDANQYIHCTLYTRMDFAAQGDGANNNKFTNSALRLGISIASGSVTSTSNYNAFGAGSIINGGNLATWRTANSSDANSVQGTFTVAGGADPTLPSYYKLTGVGINAASDGTDMGANTATVGPQAP